MRTRLDPEERRQRIADAAIPLFARKGFSGTTTKEIAEAAGVSEGLVFKYFATKTALYEAILARCEKANPDFERLQFLQPSTATLVAIVAHLVGYFAHIRRHCSDAELGRHQLFFRSLLEDGEFAAAGMEAFREAVLPMLERSLAAAKASGDLDDDVPADMAFRLGAKLEIMIGAFAFTDRMQADRMRANGAPDADRDIAEAVRFILRGMGVRSEAIGRLYHPSGERPDDLKPLRRAG